MDAQGFVLTKCLDKGFFVMQKKRYSKINEAARLAARAGLMTFISDNKLALTRGGVVKAVKLKEQQNEQAKK